MSPDRNLSAKTRPPLVGPTKLRAFSNSLPMMLLRARESVMRHFRASLRSHDVTEQQWRVLRALSTVPGLEVAQLANATYLLGPSLSRILRDLQQRALVVRTAESKDLRVGFVSITAKGSNLIATIAPESEAIYAEITARFGPQRLAELQALLVDLEQCLMAPDIFAPARRR